MTEKIESKSKPDLSAPKEVPSHFAYSGKRTFVLWPSDTVEQRKLREFLDREFEKLEHPPTVNDKLPAGMLNDQNVVYALVHARSRGKIGQDRYGTIETPKVVGPFMCADYVQEDQYGLSLLQTPALIDALQQAIKKAGSNLSVRASADKDVRQKTIFLAGT